MALRLASGLIAALVGGAPAALAHHSFAPVDVSSTVAVKGEVTEFRWTNPHSWVVLDVAEADGTVTSWSVEMSAPVRLFRLGWRREDFVPGDQVVLEIHPLHSGKPGGALVRAILADGRALEDAPVGGGR
jgi:hypothetical protein